MADTVREPPNDAEKSGALPTLAPGERLGRYVVLSMLGQGGMSVVYLAYDPQLDRKVALKLVRVEVLGTTGRQRLLREAQALARLSSPHVVPVYDVEPVGDQIFVAMEYVEGQTLREWLVERRPSREILRILRDAGRGLAAAHAAGLVHRDFKPENVLLGRDGRVRVVDFGLARTADDRASDPEWPASPPAGDPLSTPVTRFGQVFGTPGYMAPEQAQSGATDARADQFAFCVVLYEALWRRKPFDPAQHATPEDPTIVDGGGRSKAHPRAPHFLDPPRSSDAPGWILKIIRRGLAFKPADRWSSMDELLEQLRRDPARTRRRIFAAAIGLALVAGGLVFAQRSQQRQGQMCRGGEARLGEVWNDAARTRIREAFSRTNLPYAAGAADGFTRVVDDYARGWTTMHRDTCEATRLRGEQSEELLDLRMACLDGRLRELAALTGVMGEADAAAVREASRAGRALVPLSQCADSAALRAQTPRPRDPEQKRAIEVLEKRLAEFKAQFDVGRFKAALALAQPIVKDAQALGWAPLLADAQLGQARAYADLGDEVRSIPAFRAAFATALAARSDRILAWCAMRVAQEYLYQRNLDEFRAWDAVAQATIARIGGDARIEAFESILRCQGLEVAGKIEGRLECLRRHVERFEKASPPTEWEYTLLGIAAGETSHYQEAVDWIRRGVEYSTRVSGALHPRTLEMRAYLCKALGELGEIEQARAECEDALVTARRVAADNEYLIGRVELYLGIVLREAEKWDEARRHLLEAMKSVKPESDVLTQLGQVELGAGRRVQAIAYFKQALATDEKLYPADHPNLMVDLLMLGEALGREGVPLLERAAKICERADVNPLDAAQVWFVLAQILGGGERALKLAEKAYAAYARAPHTTKFNQQRLRINRWMIDHGGKLPAIDP